MEERKVQIAEVLKVIEPLYQQALCRIHVRPDGSVSLGFGEKIPHNNKKLPFDYYGAWEVGSYHNIWRLVHKKKTLCTGNISENAAEQIQNILTETLSNPIQRMEMLSESDVRLIFAGEIYMDFFSLMEWEDELFHIFCPENRCIKFEPNIGWSINRSKI